MLTSKKVISSIILFTFLSIAFFGGVFELGHPSGLVSFPSATISFTTSQTSQSGTLVSNQTKLSSHHVQVTRPLVFVPPSPQTCLNNVSYRAQVSVSSRIALVKPVFTATPYSQYPTGSFYAFYHKFAHATGNITTDLNWLNTTVSSGLGYNSGWGLSYNLYNFLDSTSAARCGLVMGRNLKVLTDINVSQGALFFRNGSRKFDVVIVGFSEYVTMQEYLGYKNFVATGGSLMVMDSDAFQVQVLYSNRSNYETYSIGHGFAFNGKTAWPYPSSPWSVNNTNWLGSYLCCFHRFQYHGAISSSQNAIGQTLYGVFKGRIFLKYTSHEENGISNFTDTAIIATFENSSVAFVASYVHQYKQGRVYCLCVFGDDIMASDPSAQYFLVECVKFATINSSNTVSALGTSVQAGVFYPSVALSSWNAIPFNLFPVSSLILPSKKQWKVMN